MRSKVPAKRGFTLIELLVVIGIIGVLAAIILPAMHAARERGRTAKCQSNLHQIGLALQQYATDFDGLLPHDGEDNPPDSCWYFLIDPYLETQGTEDLDINEVKKCPGVRRTKEQRPESYKMNSRLENNPDDPVPVPFRDIATVPRPSATVCVFDGQTGGPTISFKGRAQAPDKRDSDFSKRHQRGGNILFLDWHVKWYSANYVDSDSLKNDGKGVIVWDVLGILGETDSD